MMLPVTHKQHIVQITADDVCLPWHSLMFEAHHKTFTAFAEEGVS